MRLPCDATLIVIDLQQAIDDPRWGPRNNPGAEEKIAALLAAWRAEGLPIIHIRHDSVEPGSPYAPMRPDTFQACATPLEGETVDRQDRQQRLRRHRPRGGARRDRRDDAGRLRRADQ